MHEVMVRINDVGTYLINMKGEHDMLVLYAGDVLIESPGGMLRKATKEEIQEMIDEDEL